MRTLFIFIIITLSMSWIAFIPNVPVSDQAIYHRTAVDLASGLGYIDDSGQPWGYWAPGYSFYLAFFYKVFGPSVPIAFFANWTAYLLLAIGVYLLGKELYGKKVGFWAASLTALYPGFLLSNTILMSETLYTAITVWIIYCCWKSCKDPFPWIAFCGILCGCAALVRGQGLILPLIAPVIGYVRRTPFTKTLFLFITTLCLMALVCLPWGLRNKRELGEFVLVSANAGANLWIGNHPGADGNYMDPQPHLNEKGIAALPFSKRDHMLKEEAINYIISHPLAYVKLISERTFLTMRRESIPVVWNEEGIRARFGGGAVEIFKVVTNGTYFLLIAVTTWALLLSLLKKQMQREDLVIAAAVILLSLPFILILGQDRFHLPLIPFFILFSLRACFKK